MKTKIIKSVSFFSGLLLLFSGCYSYPPLPEPVSRNEYSSIRSEEHRSLPTEEGMLSLRQAREIALANNPDYRSARHAMVAAQARYHQALTAYLPTLNASYDQTEFRRQPMARGGRGGRLFNDKTANLAADWVVFNGLVRTMDALAARHSSRQSEELNKDARRLLLQSVGETYNRVLLTRENIRIAKADEDFNRKLLDETELKYEAGAVSLSEVLNFRIRVNEARSSLLTAKFNFFVARSMLAELLGLTAAIIPPETIPPMSEIDEPTAETSIDAELDAALVNRPDLVAYREALSGSQYALYARYGAFFPTISLHADYGYMRRDPDYSGRWRYSWRTEDRSFNYGVTATWVIFNGGRRIFELREAQANLAASREAVTEQWITVIAEVRQAYENLFQQSQQLDIARETLELVSRTRDLVEEEYKAGNANLTRLNEAQRDLIGADTGLVSARINLANAKLQMEAATGKDPLQP